MTYYLINLGTLLAIFAILGVSYNLLLGYAGLFSIAHAAFFGIGAYTTGILMRDYGSPFLLALVASAALGAVVGVLLSGPARRVAGVYLVLMTLGFQFIAVELFGISDFTGGQNGLVGIPSPSVFGLDLGREGLLVAAWVICIALTWGTRATLRSPFGRLLESVREDELASQSLGKRTGTAKVQAFMASSALAALAGGLFAMHLRFISPAEFGLDRSIEVLAIVIIGGLGVFWGPYFGAIVVVAVPQALTFIDLPSSIVGHVNVIMFSLIVLLILRFRPQGLAFGRRKQTLAPTNEREADTSEEKREHCAVTLECRDVSVSFGGLKAVDGVTLTLNSGQITGLIGPNGAGKTSLFNLISGVLEPDEGEILLNGRRLNGLPLEKRVALGVVRSFQDMKLFMGMTCEQNLLLPATPSSDERVFTAPLRSRRREPIRRAQAHRMLERLGLSDAAGTLARDLSYAEQKRLMIGRLLATDADCYLLDEPMSGLDDEGRATILRLLSELAEEGATICLVEHSLSVIEAVCTRVAFLMDGRLLKEGTAAEILRDPELADLYFGTEAIAAIEAAHSEAAHFEAAHPEAGSPTSGSSR